ncbi:MAG TPA: PIG-L family deacetylase, partial [Opitutaceae bacterium]|nr:PIG-L family deacetylase [Opitutaceae bacterium]
DGRPPAQALARVTQLCVAAHQDDIEIMAHTGIAECYEGAHRRAFGGVVVTDGAGAPRVGRYAGLTDAEMRTVRREEQRRAAALGRYACLIQLAHPSSDAKQPGHAGVRADLAAIFSACAPAVVYLHNPADKHDTHVAVLLRCLEVLRALPPERRPPRVLGCEVWRGLDWLVEADKVALDAGQRSDLARQLLETFDSQTAGGKRYDLATLGRRAANATYHTAHAADEFTAITWAMDLTPLVQNAALDVADYTLAYVERLRAEVATRLAKLAGTAHRKA